MAAVVLPSVTVIWRSVVTVIVSVSLAVLLARLGSLTPFGGVTVAVSEIVPVAEELIVPVAL